MMRSTTKCAAAEAVGSGARQRGGRAEVPRSATRRREGQHRSVRGGVGAAL